MLSWRSLFLRLRNQFRSSPGRPHLPSAADSKSTEATSRTSLGPETEIGTPQQRPPVVHLGEMGLISPPHRQWKERKRAQKWI